MRVLITGICGFVGSSVARALVDLIPGVTVSGIDNLSRAGSQLNRDRLTGDGISVTHGDVRLASDVETLRDADWVIDAAANPSVLAGVDGRTSGRQLIEHNLLGTINVLEYCRARRAGLVLLSTSRVYSIARLSALALDVRGCRFALREDGQLPGVSSAGVDEHFSTDPPLSLYGASKLASELLALEYGSVFDFPVWINRCGILAGAGQFGHPSQGIVAYWINAFRRGAPLRYNGYGGMGHQLRDCLHPHDLARLIAAQLARGAAPPSIDRVQNVAGGVRNSFSLKELSDWCGERWGSREVGGAPESRQFDLPWLVLDHSRATSQWGWRPERSLEDILTEVASHADAHPEWLALSGA